MYFLFSNVSLHWVTFLTDKFAYLAYIKPRHIKPKAWTWELDHKEGWASKNWCFWTVVLEKTLESPLHCKEIKPVNPKGNQSWIFIRRLMLKLKLQYFGHVMWRTDSLAKTLMLGKIEGRRRRGWQRMKGLDGIPTWWTWVWAGSRSWWWTGKLGVLRSMVSQKVAHDWATELNWPEQILIYFSQNLQNLVDKYEINL